MSAALSKVKKRVKKAYKKGVDRGRSQSQVGQIKQNCAELDAAIAKTRGQLACLMEQNRKVGLEYEALSVKKGAPIELKTPGEPVKKQQKTQIEMPAFELIKALYPPKD